MGMLEPWRVAKGYVEHIFAELGVPHLSWKRLSSDAFWHPGRSVQAFYEGTLMATLGEVSPAVAGQFKLTQAVALVDIPLEAVLPLVKHARTYVPASVFPEAKRDVAVVVDARTEYDDIARAIRRVDALVTNVEWFDTYRGKNLPEQKKSLAMHVTFSAPDRTLESREVDAMMEKIVLRLKQDFGADLRV
jgi:phenylalanyl-tRNA synthetase beta chain